MRRGAILLAALFCAFGTAALATNDAAAQDAGAPPALPACIQVSTDARYIPYGYNHVVILKSGCSKPAACTISTDVNPQAVAAEVAAGTTVEVLTFSASPSQTFHARVTCKLR
jgi:hypothetical protein